MSKIVRLNPFRGMFIADGFHLINPERPIAHLPENFIPTPRVEAAIRSGILIDVNKNILVYDNAPQAPQGDDKAAAAAEAKANEAEEKAKAAEAKAKAAEEKAKAAEEKKAAESKK